MKSHLHLKYFEEGLKQEKAQPILEERSAYRQYTGGATNAGTGLAEASSLWPERLAARLLASEASRLSTVDRVGVEVPCLRRGGVWLYPSAFTRWTLKQVQKKKQPKKPLT